MRDRWTIIGRGLGLGATLGLLAATVVLLGRVWRLEQLLARVDALEEPGLAPPVLPPQEPTLAPTVLSPIGAAAAPDSRHRPSPISRPARRWAWRARRPPWRLLLTYLLVVHCVLAGLWLWSHDGFTTTIRLRVQGDTVSAFVDGQPVGALTAAAGPPSGGIGFAMPPASNETPSGLEPEMLSVRVRDLTSGATLFKDDFRGQFNWIAQEGPAWSSGRPPTNGGRISTGPQPWQDYEVEAVVANPVAITTYARVQDARTADSFWMRPWRHLDFSLAVTQAGQSVDSRGGLVRFSAVQTVRALLERLLRPYPVILAGTLVLLLSGRAVRAWRAPELHELGAIAAPAGPGRQARLLRPVMLVGLGLLTLAAGGALVYLQLDYTQAIPHVPDSSIYLIQGRWFSEGIVVPPAPQLPQAFSVFGNYLEALRGRWVSQYPFGHPLLLAIGWAFGAVWLVNPVVAALCIPLLFSLAGVLYRGAMGLVTAALAVVLLAVSPFYEMNGVDFMSHNSGAFYLLIALLALVVMVHTRSPRGRLATGFICGVAMGLLFNTRPLTAVGEVVFLAIVCLMLLLRQRCLWSGMLAIGAGGLLLLVAYLAYNSALTGDPLLNPYSFSNTATAENLGFGGHNNLELALRNTYTQLVLLDLLQFGWPSGLFFGLALVPFVLPRPDRRDLFLLGVALASIGAWFFYDNPFIMYGPRFWYEVAPLLVLLCARGLVIAGQRVGGIVGVWMDAAPTLQPVARVTMPAVAALVVAGLVVASLWWWWAPPDGGRPVENGVPTNVQELKGFNDVDSRLVEAARQADLHQSVVLVADCGGWWCYGSIFWLNDPLPQEGDVVYIRDDQTLRPAMRAAYPDRTFYQADWKTRSLRPLSDAELLAPS